MKILEENVNLDCQPVCSWIYANNINILSHNVERVDQIEQLGATTDDQLKWDKHVDKLCKKTLFCLVLNEAS